MKTHRSIKYLLTSFILVIISVAVITPNLAEAAYNTGNPVTDQLLDVAQAKLDSEYNVLITGDSTKLTKANLSIGGVVAQGMSANAANKLVIYKGLAKHGLHYTKFTSKLTVQKVDISGDNATITANEYVVLHLDNSTKDPVDTKEARTHIFHFTLQGNSWILDKDEDPLDSIQISQEPGIVKVTGIPISLEGKSDAPPSRNGLKKSSLNSQIITAAVMSGTFNPTNAVNYARSYWGPNISNYNSAYRYWISDCTNFVSQAMNWGGWQHVSGFYQDYHYWWYDPNGIQTYSWAGTNGYYWFARYSGRVHDARYLSDFRPGDVLQMLYSNKNGILDHTAIVTKVDSSGPYVTQHSVNALDKSFWAIYYDPRYAGAAYYGSLMNYTY